MKKITILFILIFVSSLIWAQNAMKSTIASSGSGFAFRDGQLTVNQTIAQPSLIGSFQSGSLVLLQGFQNPYFNKALSLEGELGIAVFPNPTTGAFSVLWKERQSEEVQLTLHDLHGRIMRTVIYNREGDQITVDFTDDEDIPKGTYYLIVSGQRSGYAKAIIVFM